MKTTTYTFSFTETNTPRANASPHGVFVGIRGTIRAENTDHARGRLREHGIEANSFSTGPARLGKFEMLDRNYMLKIAQ